MDDTDRPVATCGQCEHPVFWHDEDGCTFTGPEWYACTCGVNFYPRFVAV